MCHTKSKQMRFVQQKQVGTTAKYICPDCQNGLTKGSDYTGEANTTKTGLSCQMWSETSPHKHKHTGLPRNFCR